MPWSDRIAPVTMRRVAIVAPRESLRAALVRVGDAGVVELDAVPLTDTAPTPAARRLQRVGHSAEAALAAEPPDLDALEAAGRADLLAGEAALEAVAGAAVSSPTSSAVAGWTPDESMSRLAAGLAEVGGAVVPLPRPRGSQPPTLLRRRGEGGRPFGALVETYATVPYADIDPTPFAALAYVVMFGMMFGDVGHGLLVVAVAVLARLGRPRRLARLRGAAPLIAAVGAASIAFGFAYGEFFGPTGLIPVLWINPLDEPLLLLVVALGVGAALLAIAYGVGTANRVREGGWAYALYAPSGLAGATVFLGAGLLVGGLVWQLGWLVLVAALVAATGLVLSFVGLHAAAGGGGAGIVQASIELFDLVLRLGSNVVSFARLAAFGLTHAALGAVVWDATTGLWGAGAAGAVGAVLVFVVGNAVAFALEALVAAVQALRLEYYELFSRVFAAEGRPFRPWHVPVVPAPVTPEEVSR